MSLSKARGKGRSHCFWVVTFSELTFALWTSTFSPSLSSALMSVGRMNVLSCYVLYLVFGTGGFEQGLV